MPVDQAYEVFLDRWCVMFDSADTNDSALGSIGWIGRDRLRDRLKKPRLWVLQFIVSATLLNLSIFFGFFLFQAS